MVETKGVTIYDMDTDFWKRWAGYCKHKGLKIADAVRDSLTEVMDKERYPK